MSMRCRACLIPENDLRIVSEDLPTTKYLITMFKSITNFEWLDSEKAEWYLCRKCENTLTVCYDFQRKCQKSHEILLKSHLEKAGEIFDAIVEKSDGKNTEYRRNLQTHHSSRTDFSPRGIRAEITKTHGTERKFFHCDLCDKKYKSKHSLSLHFRLHSDDCPYKCAYCKKSHKSLSDMKDHERTHTREKPFMCSVCGKTFGQASALRTHMKQHTGRPEVCEICQKRFCRPSELKIHLRKHSGDKPFLCTECGKTFMQKSHLSEHYLTHSDQRPYQCPYCKKAFKQKSLLTSHLQIHSGYKPFKCSMCEYSCFKAYRLSQHMKLHNGLKTLEKNCICPVCQKTFASQAMLNSHASMSHNAIL